MISDTSAQDTPLPQQKSRRWTKTVALAAGSFGLVAALVTIAHTWGRASTPADPTQPRIATVLTGDVVRDVTADGKVIAADSPTLYAVAGGSVRLKVVAGDAVKAGQELAVINSPELQSRLIQERATLASREAEADRAHLDAEIARQAARKLLQQAEVDEVSAARDVERYQTAYAAGAVPQTDLVRATDLLKKQRLGLTSERRTFTLQSAAAAVDERNKRLVAARQREIVSDIQRQVDALTLRAPFDGQVGQIFAAQGTSVAENAPVLSVVDLRRLEVEIRVPESFARDLAVGLPAQLTTGGSASYRGEVAAISPEVVSGQVAARIRFVGEQPAGLRQSQRTSARIVIDQRRGVLKLERGPLLDQAGGRYAYVVRGDVAELVPVRLGLSSMSEVEVVQGLRAGDRVLIAAPDADGGPDRIELH